MFHIWQELCSFCRGSAVSCDRLQTELQAYAARRLFMLFSLYMIWVWIKTWVPIGQQSWSFWVLNGETHPFAYLDGVLQQVSPTAAGICISPSNASGPQATEFGLATSNFHVRLI